MKKVLLNCLKTICFFGIFCFIFLFLQEVLRGKWFVGGQNDFAMTSMFQEYRSMEENSIDVLFLGTSHVYYGIDSMHIYEQTGVTSYGLSGQGLRFDLTYFGLKEALKTQKPKVVFLDMSALHYKKQPNEARMHMYLDEITLDEEKMEFAFRSGNEELDPLGVFFPLIRYHSRWSEMDMSDLRFVFGQAEKSALRGHFVIYEQVPTTLKFDKNKKNVALTERFSGYFDKIVQLCEEEGIELVLFKVPAPGWTVLESELSAEIAKEKNLPYLELYYEMEAMGLNPETDFCDKKDHLNQYGAEKVSAYVGKYLVENYDLTDYRGKNERWDKDLATYHEYLEKEMKSE